MVIRSYLMLLMCPAHEHYIVLTLLIMSMTFVFYLTQTFVLLSSYVMLSIIISFLVCAMQVKFSSSCWMTVEVSSPYVIAGSTQELYTWLFRQMARLLLKKSQRLTMPPSLT